MSYTNNNEDDKPLKIRDVGALNDGTLVEEVQEVKRTWYSYVLESIEKLRDTVGLIINDYNIFKIDTITLMNNVKSDLKDALYSTKISLEEHIKACEDRFSSKVESMDTRLDKIESVNCLDGMKRHSELRCEFDSLKIEMEKQLQPLRIRIIKLETRLVLWSTLFGMVGSGFVGVLAYVLKDYVSEFISK